MWAGPTLCVIGGMEHVAERAAHATGGMANVAERAKRASGGMANVADPKFRYQRRYDDSGRSQIQVPAAAWSMWLSEQSAPAEVWRQWPIPTAGASGGMEYVIERAARAISRHQRSFSSALTQASKCGHRARSEGSPMAAAAIAPTRTLLRL